jgi:competence protein ComEA
VSFRREPAPDPEVVARLDRVLGREPPDPVPAPVPLPEWDADRELPSLPERLRAARRDPGRRGVAALALVGLVAAAVSGAVVLRARPHEVAVQQGAAPPRGVVSSTPAGQLVVFVGGRVARPGLVHVPAGSRVDDALTAAGGVLDPTDLLTLNPARKLSDGEQVVVGVAGVTAPGVASSPGGPLDLNAATVADLDGLDGIGPVLAQKVVDYRTEHGRFESVDQLREVSGIGEAKFAALKSKVRV